MDWIWTRREEANDVQRVYSTVKAGGKAKEELFEWKLVRCNGECV